VLRTVVQRMKAMLRSADTVARLGGDEFVLLLCDLAQPQDATQLLHRLMQEVSLPIAIGNQQVQVGVSMGVTLYNQDAGTPDELIKHADQALYQAKAQGKGCYKFYTPD